MREMMTLPGVAMDIGTAYTNSAIAFGNHLNKFLKLLNAATQSFLKAEMKNAHKHTPLDTVLDHGALMKHNMENYEKALVGAMKSHNDFWNGVDLPNGKHLPGELDKITDKTSNSMTNMMFGTDHKNNLAGYAKKKAMVTKFLAHDFDDEVESIKDEFGFNLNDTQHYEYVAETERYSLCQVKPFNGAKVNEDIPPVLIIPPRILGPNSINFHAKEKKSYVRAHSDEGIPTYVKLPKGDVISNKHLRRMIPEEEIMDIKYMLGKISERHGNVKVILSGYCEGGLVALISTASGKLNAHVSDVILGATPVEGVLTEKFAELNKRIPERFRDVSYITKKLPNGEEVIDGRAIKYAFVVGEIGRDNPVSELYANHGLVDSMYKDGLVNRLPTTIKIIKHWLDNEIRHIPKGTYLLSSNVFKELIGKDGHMPLEVFNEKPNVRLLKEKGIKVFVYETRDDDVVNKGASTRWLYEHYKNSDHVTVFKLKGGHVKPIVSLTDTSKPYSIKGDFTNGAPIWGPVGYILNREKVSLEDRVVN